jgi:hypothetical protein
MKPVTVVVAPVSGSTFDTEPPPFAVHMNRPSVATSVGKAPSVLLSVQTAPGAMAGSITYSFPGAEFPVMYILPRAHSTATAEPAPVQVPSTLPSLPCTRLTSPVPLMATQRSAPSNLTCAGLPAMAVRPVNGTEDGNPHCPRAALRLPLLRAECGRWNMPAIGRLYSIERVQCRFRSATSACENS